MLALRKRGKHWFARGVVPSRQSSGQIVNVTIERSLKTQSRNDAIKRAADLERYFWNLAHGYVENKGPTFAEAAVTYIKTRGKSDRFITRLIEHFGNTPLKDIGQAEAIEAADKLYPGWKQSSLNRAIWTPLSAIGVEGLQRPRSERSVSPIPNDAWFAKFIQANPPPKLAALVFFITLTGRRVGEALALREEAIDDRGMVLIARTKTGKPVYVAVPEFCLALLRDSGGYYRRKGAGHPSKRLFGYAYITGAYLALRATCKRAGIPVYRFHVIGRHSFATRALKAGKSIKWVKEVGGWATMSSLERYLHLEQSEVQRENEALGKTWAGQFKIMENTEENE